MRNFDRFIFALGGTTLLALVLLIVLTVFAALAEAQDGVPRPDGLPPATANTTFQTSLGAGEVMTNSVPGQPVQLGSHAGRAPAPTRPAEVAAPAAPPAAGVLVDGAPFDPSAYYKAKADFARERMKWEELEARRYARFSARMNSGGGGAMSTIIEKAMNGCSPDQGSAGGFWASIGNRMGRAKECREQQTTARVLMCQQVAIEMQEISVMNACTKMAENDNQWVGFWTTALKSGVTIAGIHYGAGILTEAIGLGKFAVDRANATAQQSIAKDPFVAPTQVLTPTVIGSPGGDLGDAGVDGGGGG